MKRIVAGLGVVAACAQFAAADTVNLKYAGSGSGRSIQLRLGSSTQNVFAGQLRHTVSNQVGPVASLLTGTLVTFCSDASEFVRSVSSTYTVTPIGNLPVSSGYPAMGSARSQAVYDLYAAAGGSQLITGADSNLAAAFQILLWEIVYDFDGSRGSLDASVGTVQERNTLGGALDAGVSAFFNSFADWIVATNAPVNNLVGLSNLGGQDQIVQVQLIPLPAPALLGALGLGVVAVARRRIGR